MAEICYKEGVYIRTDLPKYEDYVLTINNIGGKKESKVFLYGGRVFINYYHSWQYPTFFIDDIAIIKIENKKIDSELSLSEIASHLNAIETNGVDAFLEHYKKSIEFLYCELKEMNQKTESQLTIEQEDSTIKNLLSELAKIREMLFSVLAILFNLNTHMSAGLENEKVVSVCQSIMDSLA